MQVDSMFRFILLLLVCPSAWSGQGRHSDVAVPPTSTKSTAPAVPSGPATNTNDDDDDDDFGDDGEPSGPHQPPGAFGNSFGGWGTVIKQKLNSATGVDLDNIANDIVKQAKNIKDTTFNSVNKIADTVKGGKDFINNGVVIGKIIRALSKEKDLTPKILVRSFALGVSYDFKNWMPPYVSLPELEMTSRGKYMCGEGGLLYNPTTIEMEDDRLTDTSKQMDAADETEIQYHHRIQRTISHTFKQLFMYYPKFSQHWMGTVVGRLWLTFANNSVDFHYEFPSVIDVLTPTKFDHKCSVLIKNIIVTKLISPTATVENSSKWKSYWRRVAEEIVEQFARLHTLEFENLFRFGILRALVDLLKEENKYICMDHQLVTEIAESKMLKPEKTDKFTEYCTKMKGMYDTTAENDSKGSEQGSNKANNNEQLKKSQTEGTAGSEEFDFK